VSSPDSSNNDSPESGDGNRVEGGPLDALARDAHILRALTAVVDGYNASNDARFAAIEGFMSDVVNAFQEQNQLLRATLTRPALPSAGEPVARQVLEVERSMLWTWEAGREGPKALRLPRPSIIGRALFDLQQAAATAYAGSSPAEIYTTISANGRHHLSDVARDRVDRYAAGETRAMAGKINEHLEPRFEALSNRSRGRYYAENVGDRRSLTTQGERIFVNWPNWDARDDDLTGYGPSASGPTPPAGGTGAT
jgi:hypothetical protein